MVLFMLSVRDPSLDSQPVLLRPSFIVPALILQCIISIRPALAEENGGQESQGGSFIEGTHKVLEKAGEAPKEVHKYTMEKLKRAQTTPWRETADQILINDSQVRWNRYIVALTNAPRWLDVGLHHRMRYENLTNNFRQGLPSDVDGGAFRTRLRFGLDWKMFRFFAEAQNSSDVGTSSALLGTINSSLFDQDRLLQAFIAIRLDNLFGAGLRADLHVGRMTFDFGSRRLIARNEFRNTTNTFNAVHWNLAQAQDWRIRAFIGKPVSDTFGVLVPVRDTLFWGTQYETRQHPWLNLDLYYFGINGGQNVDEERRFGTYGLRVFRYAAPGWWDYETEAAFQAGTKTGRDHFAHFEHAELGYTFNVPWRPRVALQYDYASGTVDPNGQSNQTFDTLFGARRFEYNPTGVFGPFFRSNISSPGVRAGFQPRADTSVSLKYRAWYLAQAKDAWVGSGLQDPTGASGNFLGQDLELRVSWQWITDPRLIEIEVGYDYFFKGSYVQRQAEIPGNPSAQNSEFFYIQTEMRF
ncbi:alginate export family protein [Nitrospira sp.]|nr:alginate export family protein [Nitrospira sp.]